MSATTRQPHFALLLALAWLLVVLQLVAQNWHDTAQTLLDTDDAMRLVQMRDWLAGHGWPPVPRTDILADIAAEHMSPD